MLDIAPTELLLVALVALIVIGPKDLPRVMRVVGQWVGRARGVARHFRSGFDEMVRQAELEEMEKKWKAENERIMREHLIRPDPAGGPDDQAFRSGLIDDEPGDPAHEDRGAVDPAAGAVMRPLSHEGDTAMPQARPGEAQPPR